MSKGTGENIYVYGKLVLVYTSTQRAHTHTRKVHNVFFARLACVDIVAALCTEIYG